jgi:hypothetical protein
MRVNIVDEEKPVQGAEVKIVGYTVIRGQVLVPHNQKKVNLLVDDIDQVKE